MMFCYPARKCLVVTWIIIFDIGNKFSFDKENNVSGMGAGETEVIDLEWAMSVQVTSSVKAEDFIVRTWYVLWNTDTCALYARFV